MCPEVGYTTTFKPVCKRIEWERVSCVLRLQLPCKRVSGGRKTLSGSSDTMPVQAIQEAGEPALLISLNGMDQATTD